MSRKRRNRRHRHRRRQQLDETPTPPPPQQQNNINNDISVPVGRLRTPSDFRSNVLRPPKTPNVETPKGRYCYPEQRPTIGTQTPIDYTFAQIFETPKLRRGFSPYGFFAPPHGAVSTPFGGKGLFVEEFAEKKPCVKDLFRPDFTPKEKSLMEAIVFDKAKACASLHRHRFYKSASPKTAHVDRKTPRASTTIVVPKSFSPVKRFSFGCFENGVSANAGCVCNRLLARLRAFHRNYVSRWAGRFVEACAWFGLTIKMGLVAIYRPRRADVATTTPATKNCCDCEVKVRRLETEMRRTRTEHEDQIKALRDQLKAVRSELEGLRDVRLEIAEIKSKLVAGERCGDAEKLPPPPPPPPGAPVLPPPPPPPPPPMPALVENTSTGRVLKINRNKAERKSDENARPVISLDDILNVKLRKTGERAQPVRLLQRRATQPTISTDMLRQVKLRPASRPQTPLLSDVAAAAAAGATSPARSLSIILGKVDTNEIAARHVQT